MTQVVARWEISGVQCLEKAIAADTQKKIGAENETMSLVFVYSTRCARLPFSSAYLTEIIYHRVCLSLWNFKERISYGARAASVHHPRDPLSVDITDELPRHTPRG